MYLNICIDVASEQLGIPTDEVHKEFITVLQKFCDLTEEEITSITNILSVFFSPLLAVYYEEYIHILQVKSKLYINKIALAF
ncbi:MAG: hypothetical protein J6B80_04770 [Clostridia bacterium]|nr:hypothetical protein [Clostridia bacterium]